jgi:hypothetical protein
VSIGVNELVTQTLCEKLISSKLLSHRTKIQKYQSTYTVIWKRNMCNIQGNWKTTDDFWNNFLRKIRIMNNDIFASLKHNKNIQKKYIFEGPGHIVQYLWPGILKLLYEYYIMSAVPVTRPKTQRESSSLL